MRIALALGLIVLPACSPGVGASTECAAAEPPIAEGTIPVVPRCPGECDEDAARTVVHDLNGFPLYAGQALILQTCSGTGGVCHAVDASDRYGAPAGLDFDLVPIAVPEDASRRAGLLEVQRTVFEHREAIWSQLVSGAMPPGAAGADSVSADFGYVSMPLDPETDVVLAQLDTPEGREILRNWLACGAPFIERWVPVLEPCATGDDCATGVCEDGQCRGAGDEVPVLVREATP